MEAMKKVEMEEKKTCCIRLIKTLLNLAKFHKKPQRVQCNRTIRATHMAWQEFIGMNNGFALFYFSLLGHDADHSLWKHI